MKSSTTTTLGSWLLPILLTASILQDAASFHIPTPSSNRISSSSTTRLASTVSETSAMMNDVRQQLRENDDARMVMDALRGTNMNDDDAAVDGLQMKLVDVYGGKDAASTDDRLPYEYDPKALQKFFGSRPLSVLTRIFQVASVGGGFALRLGMDKLLGRIDNNPELEVQRAGELRDIITSLGPFPIKIGQALSIRPDVLSPRSMVELQVCAKMNISYDTAGILRDDCFTHPYRFVAVIFTLSLCLSTETMRQSSIVRFQNCLCNNRKGAWKASE